MRTREIIILSLIAVCLLLTTSLFAEEKAAASDDDYYAANKEYEIINNDSELLARLELEEESKARFAGKIYYEMAQERRPYQYSNKSKD